MVEKVELTWLKEDDSILHTSIWVVVVVMRAWKINSGKVWNITW